MYDYRYYTGSNLDTNMTIKKPLDIYFYIKSSYKSLKSNQLRTYKAHIFIFKKFSYLNS